jgi:hypothetical protein
MHPGLQSCVIEAPEGTVVVEIEVGGVIWQASADVTCQVCISAVQYLRTNWYVGLAQPLHMIKRD